MKALDYIYQRFPISLHLPILLLFYLTLYLFAAVHQENIILSLRTLFGFITVFLIFLHIRLLDDIKDYQQDKKQHPNRPLSQGKISLKTVKEIVVATIGIEFLINLFLGLHAFLFYLAILAYSGLIYTEYFSKDKLKNHVLISNFSHQLIIILIGLYVYTIHHSIISTISLPYIYFLAAIYLLFTLFEFTRKIKHEKDPDYQLSYTYQLGRKKISILLTIIITAISILYLLSLQYVTPQLLFYIIPLVVTIIALSITGLYSRKNKLINHRTIKNTYIFFILLILLGYISSIVLTKQIMFPISGMVIPS